MKIKSVFFTGTLLVGIFLFVFTIKKIGLNQIVSTVSMITAAQLATLIIINLSGVLISIIRWKIIMRNLGDRVSFTHLTMAKFIGLAMSYITPSVFLGGQPFRAFFLKTEADVLFRKSVASIIIDEVMFLSVTLAIIILGLFALFHHVLLSKEVSLILFTTLLLLIIIFYIFYRRTVYHTEGEKGFFSYLIEIFRLDKIRAIANVKGRIAETEKNVSVFFKNHKSVLITSIILTIVESYLYLLTYWLTILYLGYRINFQTLLAIISIAYINYLLPIPAALGSFEYSQSYIFSLYGIGEGVGLGFSIITRIISLVIVVIGLLILGYFEIKILWQKISQRIISLTEKIGKIFKS